LPKEDPLSSYTPVVEEKKVVFTQEDPIAEVAKDTNRAMDPLNSFVPEQTVEKAPDIVSTPTESIPDWLKAPTVESTKDTPSVSEIAPEITPIKPEEVIPETTEGESTAEPVDQLEKNEAPQIQDENSIPDWLKSVSTPDIVSTSDNIKSTESTPPIKEASNTNDSDKLPDWLLNSLQSEESKTENAPIDSNTTIEPLIQEETPMNLFELTESVSGSEKTQDTELPIQKETAKKEAPPVKKSLKKVKNTEKRETLAPLPTPDNTSIPDWLK
jgi:hypothetical protein